MFVHEQSHLLIQMSRSLYYDVVRFIKLSLFKVRIGPSMAYM